MDEIAKALAEFSDAQNLIAWLKANGLLKEGSDVGELAFSYAIRSGSPKVVAAFHAVAQVEKANRARVDALPKRPRPTTSEKRMNEQLAEVKRQDELRDQACALASELAPAYG